jgi:ribosomal protein L11 methylase PrmA
VLLLAAAALGVPFCVGVDVWPPAARLSRDHALGNGLAGVAVVLGSTECLQGVFPVILANLPIAAPLYQGADLTRLAAPAGVLIVSGFKDTEEEEVWSLYKEAGWELLSRRSREDWLLALPLEPNTTWVAGMLQRGGKPR